MDKYEERKKLRVEESRRAKRGNFLRKAGYWVAALAVVGLLGWLFVSRTGPQGLDFSEAIPIAGRNHIPVGGKATDYNSNPPTSGQHYPQTATNKFYDEAVPDEFVVHNLEHGNIWITYKPEISEEAKRILKKFAGGNVIVSARAQNDADVALAAWGRLDKLNIEDLLPDEQRIRDFILRYQNKGPERVSPSVHGG